MLTAKKLGRYSLKNQRCESLRRCVFGVKKKTHLAERQTYDIPPNKSFSNRLYAEFFCCYLLPKHTMSKPQTIAIKLKPAAERMVKKGHPWIFEGAITKQSADGTAGDLAIIYDQKKNKFLAIGFYDPYSPIRIKILQAHQPAKINAEWFTEKIKAAFAKRKPLLETDTNSYRLIYGENDGLPGLICDVYDNVLVVKLYAHYWISKLDEVMPALLEVSEADTVVLRLSRLLQQQGDLKGYENGQVIHGTLEDEVVVFREHGLLFSANVIKGHKTGSFLDHRHNRKRVGELANGKVVLDVFAYAGGFSVHALAGGATEVTSLDISAQALKMAEGNVALNKLTNGHKTMAVDAFEGLAKLQGAEKQFDLIVIDPPSFAKQASEVAVAENQYKRLALLGAGLVKKNGILLLASCSSRILAEDFYTFMTEVLTENGYRFEVLEKTQHDVDHPIGFKEGAYLKSLYLRML
ncbi:MAG: 23S rRNA (cytosine1962-C5)-methyltransferase [Nonlabens sp.]|jgi:23S rRNA (cytosine1962-C5)-methyltransferase